MKNKSRKKKKFIKDKCAPKTDNLPYSCYTQTSLHILKRLWNARHPDVPIKTNNTRDIWDFLKVKLGQTCNRESCWLRQNFIKHNLDKDLLNYTFSPKKPKEWDKDPYTWLTSVDISKVMKQYEHRYSFFEFIGPSPIDWDKKLLYSSCVWEDLCNFNLQKKKENGKHKIGIIFNLDPHNKGGSHWVSMFINVHKKEIYYLDSYGVRIPPQIRKFVNKVIEQGAKMGDKYVFIQNRKRHQYSSTECGIYSLYLIIELVKGGDFLNVTKKRISDKKMKKLRKEYFNI